MSLFDDDDLIYDDEDIGGDEWLSEEYLVVTEGLSEPRHSSFSIGHEEQEKLFIELHSKKVMPHALIFSGLEGIGKTTMAFRLARFLLKHGQHEIADAGLFGEESLPQEISSLDVPQDDPIFTRVASGGHADLLHIARYYDESKGKLDKTLKVEALRKIETFLRKTSSEGGWRIVLVEDADTMNRNAQNAILKILEEPPANVLIILIAHRPGLLIPTIRSRARVIPFSPLSTERMGELMQKQGINLSVNDMSALSDISGGSIGLALKYAEEGGLEMLSKLLEHLNEFPEYNLEQLHKLANGLGTASQDKDYRIFSEIMQWVFQKMLFLKSRGAGGLPAYMDTKGMDYIYSNYTLAQLIDIVDTLKSHFERVEFVHLDRRDAVRHAFLMLND